MTVLESSEYMPDPGRVKKKKKTKGGVWNMHKYEGKEESTFSLGAAIVVDQYLFIIK